MDFQYNELSKTENNLIKLFQQATNTKGNESNQILNLINRKEKAKLRWDKIEQMRLDRLSDTNPNIRVDYLD
jgi:hypothetical protein